jgi:hypothetical protein
VSPVKAIEQKTGLRIPDFIIIAALGLMTWWIKTQQTTDLEHTTALVEIQTTLDRVWSVWRGSWRTPLLPAGSSGTAHFAPRRAFYGD